MNKFLIFLTIALVIWACGGTDTPSESAGTAQVAAAEAGPDGQKIYKQYCVTCHGLYGDMGASGAYNLQESALALDERKVVILNGRGAMTPFEGILDEDEIAAVAEYTFELKQ